MTSLTNEQLIHLLKDSTRDDLEYIKSILTDGHLGNPAVVAKLLTLFCYEEDLVDGLLLGDRKFALDMMISLKNETDLEKSTVFKQLNSKLQGSKDFLLKVIDQSGYIPTSFLDSFLNDKKMMFSVAKRSINVFSGLGSPLADDEGFVREVAKFWSGYGLRIASAKLLRDKDFILRILDDDGRNIKEYMPNLNPAQKDYEEFILRALNSQSGKYAHEVMKEFTESNKISNELIKVAVRHNGLCLLTKCVPKDSDLFNDEALFQEIYHTNIIVFLNIKQIVELPQNGYSNAMNVPAIVFKNNIKHFDMKFHKEYLLKMMTKYVDNISSLAEYENSLIHILSHMDLKTLKELDKEFKAMFKEESVQLISCEGNDQEISNHLWLKKSLPIFIDRRETLDLKPSAESSIKKKSPRKTMS